MTVILVMCPKVNINPRSSVDLWSPMLDAKFQDHKALVLEKNFFFTIYGHGGHPCHLTKVIIIFLNYVPSSQGGFT